MQTRVEEIDHKYVRFLSQYRFKSHILDTTIVVPVGFVCDRESIPLIRGTSIRGGYIHDYLCRIDSIPVVSKKQAADVYLEVMKYRGNSWARRYTKYWAVRIASGYFHKLKVNASYEDITGRKEII